MRAAHPDQRVNCTSNPSSTSVPSPGRPTRAPKRFRPKPVEIEAVQWTGDNAAELQAFAPGKWWPVEPEDVADEDPDITAQLLAHSTWEGMYTSDWVIRDTQGTLSTMDADVFAATYDQIGA